MAVTPSTMLELGTQAPDFDLVNAADGRSRSLADFKAKPALLVMFICNHCPFVKHIGAELARLGRDYGPQGVAIYAINSNDVENYPDDRPELMRQEAERLGYTFPYLFDETQATAKAYRAACTPDFYLFDAARSLVYRGQLDDSRPSNDSPVDGKDLREALDATLAKQALVATQKPSVGCNIKWKAGNEPDYF